MLRKSVVILAMLLSSLATQVFALGLGTVTVESALNQPLRVRIEILQLGDTRLQDVSVQMASLADFQRFNIDRIGFLSNVRFSIASSPDGNFVTLTTNQVVREPYLSFILDTRWPGGRLLSEHTILLDLPVFDTQQPVSTVRQPISPVLQPPATSTQPGVNTATSPAAPVTTPAPSAPTTAPITTPEDPAPAAPAEPVTEPVAVEAEPVASEPEPEVEPEVELQDEPATAEPEAPAPAADVTEPEDAAIEVETEAASAEPATIETTATDTLSDIALQVRPDSSVSMQQTMLAIQRLNPDAFIDGNINRMRSGQVLRVPDLATVQSIDAREAATEINRQNQDFANTDVQPLAAPSNQTADQDATPQGQLSVVTNETAIDASSGAGQLDAAENAELDQRIAELESALAVQQEEADRARIEREELDARMDELEQQIAAAQEIIRLQDIQLAQLQDSLARAAEEQAAQQAAIAAAEAQAAEQTAARTSLPGDIMRIITGNILFVGFALVLVILLLVFLLLRRNRARIDDSDLNALDAENYVTRKTDVDDLEAREFEDYAEGDLDDELDQIIGADAVNDPLSQARALLAKGNTDQAVVLLQTALDQSPDDQELRVLLLEAFAQQGDLAAFEEQADIIGDDPEFNSKINNLRRTIKSKATAAVAREEAKPKPPLFGRKPTTDDEDRLGAASFLDDLGIDLDAFDDDDDEPSVTERSVKPIPTEVGKAAGDKAGADKAGAERKEAEKKDAEKKPATPPPAPVPSLDDDSFHPDDMDLTFDLVGDDEDAAPAAPRAAEVAADTDTAATLEFDLDDEPIVSKDSVSKDSGSEEAKPDLETFEFSVDDEPAEQKPTTEPELELETFAFDTEELNLDKPAAPSSEAPAAADENLLDFDFDKSEIQPAKTEAVVDDLETFEFDIDENPEATVVEKPAMSQADDSDTLDIDVDDFDLDDDTLNVAASADAITTIESSDDTDVDLDVDFDFDDDSAEDPAPAASTASADDAEDELDDLDFLSDDDVEIESVDDVTELSDADEVATKLELAYAYRKMGDVEGATEILQEVLKEGTPEQVKEATELMTSIKDE